MKRIYAQVKALSWAALCQITAPAFLHAIVLREWVQGKAVKMFRGLEKLSNEDKMREWGSST